MWRRVTTKDQAGRYVRVMTTGGIAVCRQAYAKTLSAEKVLGQISRPGFHYWLYEDGKGGRVALMFRYVPDCGHTCKVLHFEQTGLGYPAATKLIRAKLNVELGRLGVREFEAVPILKTNPELLASVREEFAEVVSDREDAARAFLRFDWMKDAVREEAAR